VLIDYFTTIAQIINFLVLVFLLRHFLYRPVVKSMNEREQRIASRLKEAEDRRKEAEQDRESIRKMEQEVANHREEMIARAARDAEAYRADLMKRAHDEVDREKANWYAALKSQRNAILDDIRLQAGKEVYAIARRALQDLADDDLERRIIAAFQRRLENMDASDKEKIERFYKKPGERITIRSAFEIPPDMRRKIEEALRLKVGEMKIHYERGPDLIAGIELYGNDLKIAWSIEGYLDDLAADLSRIFEQPSALAKPTSALDKTT
jgi:F-type H+-transporting ATPase subunit b